MRMHPLCAMTSKAILVHSFSGNHMTMAQCISHRWNSESCPNMHIDLTLLEYISWSKLVASHSNKSIPFQE